MEDDKEPNDSDTEFRLSDVTSFSECNENFYLLAKLIHMSVLEMKSLSKYVIENQNKMVNKCNNDMADLSEGIKSILAAHSFLYSIVIIAFSVAVISVKGIIELAIKYI